MADLLAIYDPCVVIRALKLAWISVQDQAV
jgi:hypothetical protein